ncbi:DUF3278 domain-containing protein [Aquisalibacillus elongatus]|uniref:Uncharacterized protein DUF3278 n=1 Tax=Aquisalibacillus elongatus TaxID=485577 RepID=A0A3N5AZZ9_9BACI|nr:DUF3278 domain-containing protein [Aquisalibacillus elongatus]RPF50654.1 uncharacterized protein DUF3278 [Aquisalibacillus elongatus]
MKQKLLKQFIGVLDDRDEYQKHEIYKELAFSGIVLWYLSMTLMFVSLVMDTMSNQISLVTVLLFLVNMVYAFMITIRIRKKGLDETDCESEEEYINKIKQLKKSSTLAGVFWGLTMLVLMDYIFPYISTGNITFNAVNLVTWALGGSVFGAVFYFVSKSRLKKQY